jgi:DNA repair exonuclease SbcCD ATPase subunit
MAAKRSFNELKPLVSRVAYELLAEGRNPTVRAIRERVRASTNDVTDALAQWRKGLRAELEKQAPDYGLPAHVAEYVRIGLRAAEQLRASAEGKGIEGMVRVLEERNAALEAEVRLMDRQRGEFLESLKRLQSDLSMARADVARGKQAQAAYEEARAMAGRLMSERNDARERAARVEVLEQQLDDANRMLAKAVEELTVLRATRAAKRGRQRPSIAQAIGKVARTGSGQRKVARRAASPKAKQRTAAPGQGARKPRGKSPGQRKQGHKRRQSGGRAKVGRVRMTRRQ